MKTKNVYVFNYFKNLFKRIDICATNAAITRVDHLNFLVAQANAPEEE